VRDFGGTFAEWEVQQRDAAMQRRASDALAAGARREQEKTRARKNATAQDEDHAARRSARRMLELAEREVRDLERRVTELREALGDAGLYDGSAENARRAGSLDQELTRAQRALDGAMARWAEAAETPS
jgi:hypothetical protein